MILLIIFLIALFILPIILNEYSNNKNIKKEFNYTKRNFMTKTELNFYDKIKGLENEYKIVPQINLGTIIEKKDKGFRNELFKNIDFAIFDKNFENILILIELNDSSHFQSKRKKRDITVKEICNKANIKLITFYTQYSNEKEYVINRIKKEIMSLEI